MHPTTSFPQVAKKSHLQKRYSLNIHARQEILDDLKLDMDDYELEKKLHKLVKADIIAGSSSNFDYKGLGDPIFAMVIRKKYQQEIDLVPLQDIERDLNRCAIDVRIDLDDRANRPIAADLQRAIQAGDAPQQPARGARFRILVGGPAARTRGLPPTAPGRRVGSIWEHD